jgi:hypothetical protein
MSTSRQVHAVHAAPCSCGSEISEAPGYLALHVTFNLCTGQSSLSWKLTKSPGHRQLCDHGDIGRRGTVQFAAPFASVRELRQVRQRAVGGRRQLEGNPRPMRGSLHGCCRCLLRCAALPLGGWRCHSQHCQQQCGNVRGCHRVVWHCTDLCHRRNMMKSLCSGRNLNDCTS